MPGAVIILFVMFIAGPIATFVLGAVLSAVMGWSLTTNAADEAVAAADITTT